MAIIYLLLSTLFFTPVPTFASESFNVYQATVCDAFVAGDMVTRYGLGKTQAGKLVAVDLPASEYLETLERIILLIENASPESLALLGAHLASPVGKGDSIPRYMFSMIAEAKWPAILLEELAEPQFLKRTIQLERAIDNEDSTSSEAMLTLSSLNQNLGLQLVFTDLLTRIRNPNLVVYPEGSPMRLNQIQQLLIRRTMGKNYQFLRDLFEVAPIAQQIVGGFGVSEWKVDGIAAAAKPDSEGLDQNDGIREVPGNRKSIRLVLENRDHYNLAMSKIVFRLEDQARKLMSKKNLSFAIAMNEVVRQQIKSGSELNSFLLSLAFELNGGEWSYGAENLRNVLKAKIKDVIREFKQVLDSGQYNERVPHRSYRLFRTLVLSQQQADCVSL